MSGPPTESHSPPSDLAELLTPPAREHAETSPEGYVDLLGAAGPDSTGLAQDLMVSRLVPRVYERWWRPALGRMAKGLSGPGMSEERRIAVGLLEIGPDDRVLDVACGTGAFTRDFGRAVGTRGLAVGADVSRTMLARAVAATDFGALPQVHFVRSDVLDSPFRARSFDGVCCFAALHLFPQPLVALDRLTEALAPGGRIAIFTSARGQSAPRRLVEPIVERTTGMRMFERGELVEALRQRGFARVRQRLAGATQFVGGRLAD